jgi:hypothetical protein
MFKKFFLLLTFFLLTQITPVMAEEFSFLNGEKIGDFSLGQSEKELKNKIHCTLKRGPDTLWGADGAYHQTWDCYDGGISFDMVSNSKGGAKTIASITISTPSKLKTKRGIQIGDSEQAVIQAYQNEKDADATTPTEVFVAGSVYGGLIFQFKDGKVESIFLGASAE